jgi:hypothetical protein
MCGMGSNKRTFQARSARRRHTPQRQHGARPIRRLLLTRKRLIEDWHELWQSNANAVLADDRPRDCLPYSFHWVRSLSRDQRNRPTLARSSSWRRGQRPHSGVIAPLTPANAVAELSGLRTSIVNKLHAKRIRCVPGKNTTMSLG